MKKFLLPVCLGTLIILSGCAGNPPEAEITTTPDQPFATAPATTADTVSAVATIPATTSNTLNATPGATVTNAAPQKPATVPVQSKTAKTAAGINPAHGLPGHRCDIEVGAPLNSAPQQSAQVAAPPTTAKPVTSANGVKLNPPHGQPGHDCAVNVGDPLKN